MSEVTVNKNFNGSFEVVIRHRVSDGYEDIHPVVEDGVKWETERQGSPGKLTFKVYDDGSGKLTFQEGDGVALLFDDSEKGKITIFSGYVFTKKRSKDGWIDVTAYDQLRYLKNKATYCETNKKASDLVKKISGDYKLPVGTIDDTEYVIGKICEDNQSLFDIILNALDKTLVSSKKKYVLYADDGKVCLRNVENLKTDLVINDVTAEDFDYSSSIDEETYNDIELYYNNSETNTVEFYHAYDTKTMDQWGVLRLTEQIHNPANVMDRARKMLEIYDRETRKLDVKGAFGDYRCRAGASVIVNLNLGDNTVSNYMLIEKAVHTFKKDEYRMDLTLDGFKGVERTITPQYSVAGVSGGGVSGSYDRTEPNNDNFKRHTTEVIINVTRSIKNYGYIRVWYTPKDGERTYEVINSGLMGQTFSWKRTVKSDTDVVVSIGLPVDKYGNKTGNCKVSGQPEWESTQQDRENELRYETNVKFNASVTLNLEWTQ